VSGLETGHLAVACRSRPRRNVPIDPASVGVLIAIHRLRRAAQPDPSQDSLDGLLSFRIGRDPMVGINGLLARIVGRNGQGQITRISVEQVAQKPPAMFSRGWYTSRTPSADAVWGISVSNRERDRWRLEGSVNCLRVEASQS